MKFTNDKFVSTFFIYASGRNESAQISLRYNDYVDNLFYKMNLDEANEMLKCLKLAIDDCERRKNLKEDE